MPDEIKRLHYYDQQFLREPDFTDEQKYHMDMRRRLNRVLHGWGIVEGLKTVKKNNSTATIRPGMALDADGREIIVTQDQDVIIPGGPSNANKTYYVTIKYKSPEDLTDPPPPQYMIDPSDRTRVTERPEIPLPSLATPADRTLVLGTVVLDGSGNILSINENARQYAPKGIDGKLGVGTLNPLYRLHVTASGGFGNENADGTSQAGSVPLVVQSDSTVFGALNSHGRQAFALNIEGNGATSAARGTPVFYDKYDGTWHRSIYLKNGKVGIGTQDPGAKLEIVGTGGTSIDFKVNGRLQSNNNDGGLYIASDRFVGGHSTDKIGFWNGNAWQLTVQRDGNVGIGTTSPQAKLNIKGNGGILDLEGTDHAYMQWYPQGYANGRKAWIGFGSAGDTSLTIRNDAGRMHIYGIEKLFLLNRDGVIIGKEWDGNGNLTVEGDITVNGTVALGTAGLVYVDSNATTDVEHPATPVGCKMHIDRDGNVLLAGNLGTHGKHHRPLKAGWGGGIRTWDIEAEGTIWSRQSVQTGPRDLAENYESVTPLDPGDVVRLHPTEDSIGLSEMANDELLLGVISTKPGYLLNAGPEMDLKKNIYPVALCGRVPCKVVDEGGPIKRGDLLTSSSTPGRAMKAKSVSEGFHVSFRPGTIIGKALSNHYSGEGVIEIFVFLR